MIKNQAGQTIELYAYDYSTGAPKTGDAANLTFYVAKDGGSVTALADTSAAELSSTNAPGWYRCDLSAAETNFDNALFTGKSSTSNVIVVGRPASTTATYLAEMIARFLSMVEAAAGSPNEFRFTADALVRAPSGSFSGPSAAAIADAVWDEAISGHAISGSTGEALGAISSIPTATENADALLNRDMSAVSDTNARSPLNALRFIRNKWSIAAGTLTVTKENDSTTAWTASVSTTAGADPVTGNDPT